MATAKLNAILEQFHNVEGVPFYIPFNKANTNPIVQKLYLQLLVSQGGISYYRYDKHSRSFIRSNDNKSLPITNTTATYAFVILKPKDKPIEFRMGMTHHCILAIGNSIDEELMNEILAIKRQNENMSEGRAVQTETISPVLRFSRVGYVDNLGYINYLAQQLGDKLDTFIQERTPPVIAAGDITFTDGRIVRINDQSGGFNICPKDPRFIEKRLCILTALEAFDLPIDKFKPVVRFEFEPMYLSKDSKVLELRELDSRRLFTTA